MGSEGVRALCTFQVNIISLIDNIPECECGQMSGNVWTVCIAIKTFVRTSELNWVLEVRRISMDVEALLPDLIGIETRLMNDTCANLKMHRFIHDTVRIDTVSWITIQELQAINNLPTQFRDSGKSLSRTPLSVMLYSYKKAIKVK